MIAQDQVAAGLDVHGRPTALRTVFGSVASGELAGAVSATQFPDVACRLVSIKAVASNVGKVYVGGAGVTAPDGTTDATTGYELAAGEELGWLPIDNLNRLYRICDNAGDDLVYFAVNV